MAPTVLIADDDGISRKLLRRLLEQDGYAVLAAADGVEALELLRVRPAGKRSMPVTDYLRGHAPAARVAA